MGQSIFYSDNTEPRQYNRPFDATIFKANEKYLDHYSNYLILDAMLHKPKDPTEKRQVLKELTICERKMKWCTQQPLYHQPTVTFECAKLKKLWTDRK